MTEKNSLNEMQKTQVETTAAEIQSTQVAAVTAGAGAGIQTAQSQWHNQIAGVKKDNKFKPTMTDFIFALIAFALGYMFTRWVLFIWNGWGVSVFTALYLAAATAYLIRKGAFVLSREAVFWFAVTFLTGISYALWVNQGFAGVRALFLFSSAVYYILVASGTTLMGKTSNFLFLDGIRVVIVLPFRNLLNQYVSFSALVRGEKRSKILPTLIGIVAVVILASIILPLLITADAGGFGVVIEFLRPNIGPRMIGNIVYIILAIPVAAYLFGLISGAIHKKGTDAISREGAKNTVEALRVLQPITLNIILGAVSVIYLIFILSQLPYFFSAFTGVKPEGWLAYSEFARQGFFELVTIAGINLAILTACNILSKKHRIESRVLKMFNIILAVITLILIATAFSKMALYIGAFGLTMRRLLPCVFMVFLSIVFIALIALQKWDFSIVRFSLIAGAVILVGLSLSNPDAMVVRYNANRYMAGTLSEFDPEIARRSGPAGVLPALEVYNSTDNHVLRGHLRWYLSFHSSHWYDINRISFETNRAVQATSELRPQAPLPVINPD